MIGAKKLTPQARLKGCLATAQRTNPAPHVRGAKTRAISGAQSYLALRLRPGRGGKPVCWVSMRPCVTVDVRTPTAVLFLRRALVYSVAPAG